MSLSSQFSSFGIMLKTLYFNVETNFYNHTCMVEWYGEIGKVLNILDSESDNINLKNCTVYTQHISYLAIYHFTLFSTVQRNMLTIMSRNLSTIIILRFHFRTEARKKNNFFNISLPHQHPSPLVPTS